jgi:integrase
VRELLSTLDCTNKRIRNILSALRTALGVAVRGGILANNILKGWSYTRKETLAQRKKRKASLDSFSMLEQSSILEALPEQGMNLMQFAYWTGTGTRTRTSELVALTWADIGWIDNTINVDKGLTQAADEPEITKTDAGERINKLLKLARLALERQRRHTQQADGVIFHNPRTNTPWEGDQAIRKTLWKPALRKAKVRYRKPYQTRYTYASMMISSGEQIGWVSKQLGHATITVTTTTYAT